MPQVKKGDTVRVHYTGKLDNGTVFDTSSKNDPLEFTVGAQQVIPGFDQAILGMNPGDSKTAKIPSDQAYGPHEPEKVLFVDRSQIPNNLQPELGQRLQVQQNNGQPFMVTVTEISPQGVTLDANHPLAGEDLIFDIELVQIV